jgi:hypothetical protein
LTSLYCCRKLQAQFNAEKELGGFDYARPLTIQQQLGQIQKFQQAMMHQLTAAQQGRYGDVLDTSLVNRITPQQEEQQLLAQLQHAQQEELSQIDQHRQHQSQCHSVATQRQLVLVPQQQQHALHDQPATATPLDSNEQCLLQQAGTEITAGWEVQGNHLPAEPAEDSMLFTSPSGTCTRAERIQRGLQTLGGLHWQPFVMRSPDLSQRQQQIPTQVTARPAMSTLPAQGTASLAMPALPTQVAARPAMSTLPAQGTATLAVPALPTQVAARPAMSTLPAQGTATLAMPALPTQVATRPAMQPQCYGIVEPGAAPFSHDAFGHMLLPNISGDASAARALHPSGQQLPGHSMSGTQLQATTEFVAHLVMGVMQQYGFQPAAHYTAPTSQQQSLVPGAVSAAAPSGSKSISSGVPPMGSFSSIEELWRWYSDPAVMRSTQQTPLQMEEAGDTSWRQALDKRRWSEYKAYFEVIEKHTIHLSTRHGRVKTMLEAACDLDRLRNKQKVCAYLKKLKQEQKQRVLENGTNI